MVRSLIIFGACASFAAGTAPAQVPINPGGMGEGPQARPVGTGENDSIANSAANRAADEAQRSATERAAAAARRAGGPARPAKPAEIVAGAALADVQGEAVGTIEKVESDGAVVATAAGKVKVPLEAFGRNKSGLLIGMKKSDFDALVAKANAG